MFPHPAFALAASMSAAFAWAAIEAGMKLAYGAWLPMLSVEPSLETLENGPMGNVMIRTGYRRGKSRFIESAIEAELKAGKTVYVASLGGDTMRRRHKSGLTIITPVRPQERGVTVSILSEDEAGDDDGRV